MGATDHRRGTTVSVWASVCGQDPTVYDGGYGDEILPDGWIDVAVSCIDSRVRIIVQDDEGSSCISLDPAGLAELHRRIVIARGQVTPTGRSR